MAIATTSVFEGNELVEKDSWGTSKIATTRKEECPVKKKEEKKRKKEKKKKKKKSVHVKKCPCQD